MIETQVRDVLVLLLQSVASAVWRVEETSGRRLTSLQCLSEILALISQGTFQVVASSYTKGTLMEHAMLDCAEHDHDLGR